jgi:hypothetical protein
MHTASLTNECKAARAWIEGWHAHEWVGTALE